MSFLFETTPLRVSFLAIFVGLSVPCGVLRAGQSLAGESGRQAAQQAQTTTQAQQLQERESRDVTEVTFPKTFRPVWYRPEKLGFSVKAYRSSGDLVLEKDGLSFKTDKETMRITYEQIQSVEYTVIRGAMGTYEQDWVLMRFRGADGSSQVALFRDGRSLGHGQDTNLIFSSIRWAVSASQHGMEAKLAPLERIAHWIERCEAMEASKPTGYSNDELKKGLEQSSAEMTTYLGNHPDDVDALILSARMGRFREATQQVVTSGGKMEEELAQAEKQSRERADALAGQLDRALTLQPNRADAHYWKARIYGIRQPALRDGKFVKVSIDLHEAVRSSRRAVELSPENVAYREALAQYLVSDGKHDDPAEVMRAVANGEHPISLLLADRKAVPIPEGAVFLAEGREGFAEMQMERGRIHDYPMLRVRQYVIQTPAFEVTAFYRQRWPGFQFFEMGTEKEKEMETRIYGQVLSGPSNALQPARSKRDVGKDKDEYGPEGPTLMLSEIRLKSPDVPRGFKGIPVGDVFCILYVINGRLPAARRPQTKPPAAEEKVLTPLKPPPAEEKPLSPPKPATEEKPLSPPSAGQSIAKQSTQEDRRKLNAEIGELQDAGRYSDAVPLREEWLKMTEAAYGPRDETVADAFMAMADLYVRVGRYPEAEPLYKRAQGISKWKFDTILLKLVELYSLQGRQTDEELARQHLIQLAEQGKATGGTLDLTFLARFYTEHRKFTEAESLYRRVIEIEEKESGPYGYYVPEKLYELADLYETQQKYAEAEPLYRRALAILEKEKKSRHPVSVPCASLILGEFYRKQGRLKDAEPHLRSAIAIWEKENWEERRKRNATAEPCYGLGLRHINAYADALRDLAEIYGEQGRVTEAEALYRRALALDIRLPSVAAAARSYAALLRKLNREAEAAELEARFPNPKPAIPPQ